MKILAYLRKKCLNIEEEKSGKSPTEAFQAQDTVDLYTTGPLHPRNHLDVVLDVDVKEESPIVPPLYIRMIKIYLNLLPFHPALFN